MAYFKTSNLSNPESKQTTLSNFKGVDYRNTKVNVASNRSPDAINLIYKDGVNQKRNGWEEVGYVPSSKINGYWEYEDSFNKKHRILHAGNKIYRVTGDNLFTFKCTDIVPETTYYPSYTNLNNIKSKIANGIKDQRSFGIIRGDRLYILCGVYLVYGWWTKDSNDNPIYELRLVEDNVDTYIPTTTVSIGAYGSNYGGKAYALDESNMLSTRKINTLIGEEISVCKQPKKYALVGCGAGFSGSLLFSFDGEIKQVINKITLYIDIKNSSDVVTTESVVCDFSSDLSIFCNKKNFDNTSFATNTNSNLYEVDTYVSRGADDSFLINTYISTKEGYSPESVTMEVVSYPYYQLDSYPIAKATDNDDEKYFYYQAPKVTLTKDDGTKVTLEEGTNYYIDYTLGVLMLIPSETLSYASVIDGNANISVEYTPVRKEYFADKINGCTFGALFGYNDLDYLFVSGNPKYPNIDWHTGSRGLNASNNSLSIYDDLTYFGELSYARVGSQNQKITGYVNLDDTTLAIIKEQSNIEPCLYIRLVTMEAVRDVGGNVIYKADGSTFYKPQFSQFSSTNGVGGFTPYTSGTLTGDKLTLTRDGIVGLQIIKNNLKTNDQYALCRSDLINNKLLKEDLSDVVATIYDNKYFLSIGNGRVYVADGNFKSNLDGDLTNTFSYEYYVWDNVPAYTWFKIGPNLAFGTKDGKICVFNDEVNYVDKAYDIVKNSSGDITVSNTYGITYDEDINLQDYDKIDFGDVTNGTFTNFYQVVALYNDLSLQTTENNISYYSISNNDKFYHCITFFDNKEVIIDEVTHTLHVDYDNERIYFDDGNLVTLATSDSAIIAPIENENTIKLFEGTNADGEVTTYFKIIQDTIETINEETGTEETTNYYKELVNNTSNLIGLIRRWKNVECYWYTPVLTLGTTLYLKTLKDVNIVPDMVKNGELYLKLIVRENEFAFRTEGVSTIIDKENEDDYFYNFNFLDYTHQVSNFMRSFTKKCKIRNFNFIQALYYSNDNMNCIVNAITLNYNINKKSKGVK